MKKTADYTEKPYAQWVEATLKNMFEVDPVSIALQMRDASGQTYTCYYMCSRDDLAIMTDAVRDDQIVSLLRDCKEIISEILSGEDGDEDGLCEPDTEVDSEG